MFDEEPNVKRIRLVLMVDYELPEEKEVPISCYENLYDVIDDCKTPNETFLYAVSFFDTNDELVYDWDHSKASHIHFRNWDLDTATRRNEHDASLVSPVIGDSDDLEEIEQEIERAIDEGFGVHCGKCLDVKVQIKK